MELLRGGKIYCKPRPRCPVHGTMRLAGPPPSLLWTCAGWDGEGCDYQAGSGELPWAYIGDVSAEP